MKARRKTNVYVPCRDIFSGGSFFVGTFLGKKKFDCQNFMEERESMRKSF